MLKKLFTTGVLLVAFNAQAAMLITNVVDGPLTGGLPKAVELYVLNDIPDLSTYGIGSANNGAGSSGVEFTFPADAAVAGEYIYIATEATGFAAFFGFPPDYTHGSAISINGDDAIELFQNGVVIDLFGEINVDGTGQPWDYLDGWAARKRGSAPSAVFNINDWTFSGVDALDGASSNDTAAIPVPVMSFSDDGSGGGDGGDGEQPELTLISAVQGKPSTYGSNSFGEVDVSPLIGTAVTIEGVVVGDFQRNDSDATRDLRGFFVQEQSSDEDGDASSSEGIFVFDNTFGVDVNVGDLVRVSGTVDQYFGETQLSSVTSVEVLAADQLALVSPATIILPESDTVTLSQNNKYQPDLEAYEGMLVTFAQTLVINEQFQLDRFNEIKLVAGERPYQFTQLKTPDPALYDAWIRAIGARTVTYDDGLSVQNANIGLLDGFAVYTEANAKRMGDSVSNLTGVLDYKWAGNAASGATWRVHSHLDGINVFTSTENGDSANPRPLDAPLVSGSLKVTSFNVLNFFTTLNSGGAVTAAGHEPRGANSAAEFNRQLAKTVNAILALDADILGLVEIENEFDSVNDGSTAVEFLVNALNAEAGATLYNYVYPGSQFVGSDAIAVAFIYKPAIVEVTTGTQAAQLDDAVAATLPAFAGHDFIADPLFNGVATNRVSLAVSFTHLQSKDSLTVVVNHFKSKGSSGLDDPSSELYDPSSPNYDQLDGAGFWNARRLDAATAVQQWLQTSPTGLDDADQIILGDLNSYAMEAPVQYLLSNGFNNVEDEQAYSYVFDGQIGTLDYVLLSDALYAKLADAAVWHINADEADALDYNLDFGKSAAYFDATTATRNSDHDPLLVGLDLSYDTTSVSDLIAALLSGYDDGSIDGEGKHALLRLLNQLRFATILYAAQTAEHHGAQVQLCLSLKLANLRSDGQGSLPDLISGSGVPALNAMVVKSLSDYSCN